MSKYCIYWDRPATGLTVDDESFGGCTIFGVHHDCEKCPNLIEMGERKSYDTPTENQLMPDIIDGLLEMFDEFLP